MDQIRKSLQEIYASSPIAAAFLSADGEVLWINEAARRRHPALLLPQGVTQLLTLEQNQELTQRLQKRESFALTPGLSAVQLVFLPTADFWLMQVVARGEERDNPFFPEGPERMILTFEANQRLPVARILSGASALARLSDARDDVELDTLSQQINVAAYRILRFTLTMSEYLRIQHGAEPPDCGCSDLARVASAFCVTAAFATERVGIPLEADLPHHAVPVAADATKLVHVLSHLVSNSCRFTRPGNRVRLSLEERGDSAVLAVSDEGLGIEPERLSRVLEPFYSRAADGSPDKGSGLGLTVASQLIRSMGGTLAISSEYGEGTTVTLRLPLAEGTGDAPPLSSPPPNLVSELRDRFSVMQVILSDACGAPRP